MPRRGLKREKSDIFIKKSAPDSKFLQISSIFRVWARNFVHGGQFPIGNVISSLDPMEIQEIPDLPDLTRSEWQI